MSLPPEEAPDATTTRSWRITFNAPFALSFGLLASLVLLIDVLTNGAMVQNMGLLPSWSWAGSYRMLTYIFCHANFMHLLGNLLFLLLLGPILEEKYGTWSLALMTAITAIVTGVINALLFDQGLIGASGIVFMFILLSSIVNVRKREIPLSFVFIAVIYLGGEIANSFEEDNISQFAHILGGLMGGVFGYWRLR
ncbi:MAG: rhomboid family intramembrane serine protease [Salibacteraceae bacterium]